MTDEVAVADSLMRFPVERRARPTLALMRELAPDIRDVREIIDTFHLADPAPPAQARAEADVAACLRDLDAGGTEAVAAALFDVLDTLVAAAIGVCWTARDAFAASVEARQRLSRAQASGEGWRARLRARAEAANQEWARSLLDAHARVERAESVAGVIDAAGLDRPATPAAARTGPTRTGPIRTDVVAVATSRASPPARP